MQRIPPRYLVPLGFLIALTGSILLRSVFSLETQIVDIFPGTILIGVGLGLSLGPAVEKAYTGQVTAQDVKEKLPAWVDTLKTTNVQVVKEEQNTTTQIVNETSATHATRG